MAIFNSYLLGKARKSVGNITLCYRNLKNIAQAKVFSRRDNPTPEILEQRARMKVLVQLGRRLLVVVRKGFVGIGKGTTSNAFVALNMGAVSVDGSMVGTVEYTRLKVASGILDVPKVTVSCTPEGNSYSFSQDGEEETEEGLCSAEDRVYAVFIEEATSKVKLLQLKNRGEGGISSFTLPDGWGTEGIHVYCFAVSKNGKMASDSVYQTVE